MTAKICLSHCIHWAAGRCRLEYSKGGALGSQDCPHFDQRVAGYSKPITRTDI